MKRCVCLMMAVLLLVCGCAKADEEKKAVCKVTTEGVSDEMTIEALNDTVLTTKSVMKLPFSMYGLLTEDEKTQFAEQMMDKFAVVEGIKVSYESTEDVFILTLEVDYSMAAKENLLDLGVIVEEDLDVDYISFEKTVEGLKLSGYTCE